MAIGPPTSYQLSSQTGKDNLIWLDITDSKKFFPYDIVVGCMVGGAYEAKEIVLPQGSDHMLGGHIIVIMFFGPDHDQGSHCMEVIPDWFIYVEVDPIPFFFNLHKCVALSVKCMCFVHLAR